MSLHMGGTIHRLHCGMCQKRRLIDSLNRFARSSTQGCAALLNLSGELVSELSAIELCIRAWIPGYLQDLAALNCCPRVLGHHSNTALDLKDLEHAGNC